MHLSKWTAVLAAASQAYALPVDGSITPDSQDSTAVEVSPLILASAEHEMIKRDEWDLFPASDVCKNCISTCMWFKGVIGWVYGKSTLSIARVVDYGICGVGCTSTLYLNGKGHMVPKCFDEQGFTWSYQNMANNQRFSEPSYMLQSMVKDGWIDYSDVNDL